MNKKMQTPATNQAFPVAELAIRVGDTRPVVVTMPAGFHLDGLVTFSKGTFEDLLLVRWVLHFMIEALADELADRERRVIDEIAGSSEDHPVDPVDLPF
jgi:hypothetical protein